MDIDITKLFSQQEYADLVNKKRQSINKAIKAGKLKTLKVAGKDMIYLPLIEKQ